MKHIYIPPSKTAGLNNIKLAMFGMKLLADKNKCGYYIGDKVFDFSPSPNGSGEEYLSIDQVFNVDKLFVAFPDSSPDEGKFVRLENKDYFVAGGAKLRAELGQPQIVKNETALVFSSFAPSENIQKEVDRIASFLPNDICALQLRIERDWQKYAKRKGWKDGERINGCHVVLNHLTILDKIQKSPEIPRYIYICSDEDDMIVDKSQLERDARNRGLSLIFKSDFKMNISSRVQKSVIDFGVCQKIYKYIGTPRSTFSNILCVVKAFDLGTHPEHYIFDAISDQVEKRFDFGRAVTADKAIEKYYGL